MGNQRLTTAIRESIAQTEIADLNDRLTRETARADAAEAEAKDAMLANAALREALKEVLSWHDYTDDMHKPVEVRAAYMRARAALARAGAT